MNDVNKMRRGTFQLKPVAAAVGLALLWQLPANQAFANAGFGGGTDITGKAIDVPTFFASSPQGIRPAYDPAIHGLSPTLTVDTGTPIRKFVDPLGGVYNGLENLPGMTDLQSGMPVGIPESNWLNPFNGVQTKDDYYEIAVVEYTEQLATDMMKATRLRGYVQIETANMVSKSLKDITGLIGSEHIAATYPDGSPIKDAAGNQVYFAHKPHYLGPAIVVARGTAVRIKFTNYLPYTDSSGKSVGSWNGTGGEMMIPVDETIPGGGAVLDAAGNPTALKMGQNRVAIHWHGGDTPWSNDGTPHQWFAPAGDIGYSKGIDARHPYGLGKGESTTGQSVADMPDPGPGSYNIYFPNNLSGRLMMYHDHASGITRLNAYIGNAAGYIVYDPVEMTLAANALNTTLAATVTPTTGPLAGAKIPTGLLDAVGIPLVIQDKGFVPKNVGPAAVASDGKTPASQDAKWDLGHWGQPGDLFFPHVYETNQDPNSIDGTNPVGRWDWGPWFWPVFPAQYSLPTGKYGDVTTTPEAFLDTPLVNGQLYPTMTVDPKAYRFRMLSVGNDRSFDLSFYQAVDAAGVVCDAKNTAPAPNAIAPGGVGAPATCTEVRMVPAQPTPGFPATWPTDGRVGGVPDPATAGPDIVQIGNEAGLLPQVAVWKSQPITYDQNVRTITVFNVLDHGLLLMGAERGDVLVDFTNFAGQTLILYNDAPAPLPGYDPRIDYYTGVGDQTAAGGAYDTLPGYGPNTRTVMQFKVNAANTSGTGGPLNVNALRSALPVAYAATQPAPIIPESVYNAAFGTSSVDNYASIGTGAGAKPIFLINGATAYALTGLAVNYGGSGYTTAPKVTFSAPHTPALVGDVTASATAVVTNGVVTGFTGFTAGSGYTAPPTVTIAAPPAGGTTATANVQANGYPIINKAIQELFDPVYGRMNATLAAELPFSTATVATTIPLAYVDTPIERLDAIHDGETQIWKITHNGVDSHPVHFHLVNVQVINRVGWDGTIKPPAANEVGWKETLRMNPLEDVYVAAKAVHPVTPYSLPTSQRLLDPSLGVGGTFGLTNIDPNTGGAPTSQTYLVGGVSTVVATTQYTNQLTDFDNEYVWHCHILGHEEFDFMRPMIFHPNVQVPDAPGTVTTNGATVTWADPTPYGGQDSAGIPTAGVNTAYPEPTSSPKNEIGFHVYSAAGVLRGTAVANAQTWTDPAGAAGPYTVAAFNAAGESAKGTSTTAVSGSTTVTAPGTTQAPGTTSAAGASIDGTGFIVTVTSTAGYVVGASVSGGGFPQGTTIASITSATVFTTSAASTTPGATGVTLTISIAAAGALPTPAASAAPSSLTQTLNANGTTTLSWTPVPGATSYTVNITETTSANVVKVQAPVTVNTVVTTSLTATVDLTGRTALVTTGTVAGLFVGETVSGGGFPAGTAITSINTVANSFTTTAPSTTPGATAQALTASGIAPTYTTPAPLVSGSTYAFSVTATTPSGTTVAATAGLTNSPTLAPVAFTGAADAAGSGSITLQWANNPANKNNVAGLLLKWTGATPGSFTFAPTTTGATLTGLTSGTAYGFTLQAVSNVTAFNSAAVTVTGTTITAP